MSAAVLIFPHQLFQQHPALLEKSTVSIVEEFLFFKQYKFHKQKLVLHRASMKFYEDFLCNQGHTVVYIDAGNALADVRNLIPFLTQQNIFTVHVCDPADDWLNRRLKKICAEKNVTLSAYKNPGFLSAPESKTQAGANTKKYFQTSFYTAQRKRLKLLLTEKGEPEGGKWSFDTDNRLRYPKSSTPPPLRQIPQNKYVTEAVAYVENKFSENYGQATPFIYPVTFTDAALWFDDFLKNRFNQFGVYEDAIAANEHFLHHAVLTPVLNIGLLTPQYVIENTLPFARQNNIPLNSTEGFIRQIVGWREFVKHVYTLDGGKQRTTNYWQFSKKIPPSFWNATTGIAPIDCTIKKIQQTGYCHHIERLMILGNFMLLCEFDPNEVYQWFMELFIDAYDWVMVPNIYGMTQFADGGLMTTKPYISGSNYILKMSDYKKGPWCNVWDGLFWRFMHVHRSFFLQNPRLGMLVKTFDNMPAEKKEQHLTNAATFLNSLKQ